MKKKILIRGPILSQSGYGVQSRFALRSLRQYEDFFDIYIICVGWGQTGWIAEDNEERKFIDEIIQKTYFFQKNGGQFDISLQITIPNEWEKMAPINIGYTAGIEVDKISPAWIQKSSIMDRIIVVSNHAKHGFDNTVVNAKTPEGQVVQAKNQTPVNVVGYPVMVYEPDKSFKPEFKTDFNFLCVAQWSTRKNIENTIRWFVEEFIDQEVGLVLKVSYRNNSKTDQYEIEKRIKNLLEEYDERKCKIYMIHGDLTNNEMAALYKNSKIKALINIAHGECWGLPIFEAVCEGLPVITINWGGQADFISMSVKDKKGKSKIKPLVAKVDYNIKSIQKSSVWNGVLEKGTNWAFPKQGSYKMRLRDVYKNINRYNSQAKKLQKYVLKNFEEQKMYKMFAEVVNGEEIKLVDKKELPKISLITSVFDGQEYIRSFFEDMERQTIFDQCEIVLVHPSNSPNFKEEEKIINEFKKKYPNNIVYKRFKDDPGVYGCWNEGVKISTGEYITNANLDDRKSQYSLERHAKELFLNPDIGLVYADSFITEKENETFEKNSSKGQRYNFEQFSKEAMLRGNQCHNNPMWRRELHEKHGLFDAEFKSAGDWEFFLRCAFAGETFKKINETLGLYYFSPKGLSTNPENFEWKQKEERKIFLKYQQMFNEEGEEEEGQGIIL